MESNRSIEFFDAQFQRQVRSGECQLNPFEIAALPYLSGRVLDYGCGMGNLACELARRGGSVLALDASSAAITHIQQRANTEQLPVQAMLADLRDYELDESFDSVVCIGLLHFFDCPTAFRALSRLQGRVRSGGIAVVNVLVDDTTYLDMFDQNNHCLFARNELESRFAGWQILLLEFSQFDAPEQTTKAFITLIAKKTASKVGPTLR